MARTTAVSEVVVQAPSSSIPQRQRPRPHLRDSSRERPHDSSDGMAGSADDGVAVQRRAVVPRAGCRALSVGNRRPSEEVTDEIARLRAELQDSQLRIRLAENN